MTLTYLFLPEGQHWRREITLGTRNVSFTLRHNAIATVRRPAGVPDRSPAGKFSPC